MKYLLNRVENDKYLVFDDLNLKLTIDDNASKMADKKKLSELLENLSLIESSDDKLKIFPIKKGAKLSVYSHILYEEKEALGLIKPSNLDIKQIADIEGNGGVVVSYQATVDSELHVTFLLANEVLDLKNEKNTFIRNKNSQEYSNSNAHSQSKSYLFGNKKNNDTGEKQTIKNTYQQNDLDFIEGTVRIPVPKHNNQIVEEVKRVSEGNAQIIKVILQLSTKIDFLQNEVNKTKQVDTNQRKVDEYLQIIEGLRNERAVLKKEIEQSKLIAYNELIDNLKFSKVAIARQVDLDEITTDAILKPFIDELLSSFVKQLQNKKLLKVDKRIDSVVSSICEQDSVSAPYRTVIDNFDSKIQSLQEIKKNLMSLQTLNEAGDQ